MHRGYRTRKTYAPDHRTQPARSSNATVYATTIGEGILKQTCDGTQFGFSAPIAVRQRADGTPVYFVESDKFAGRYYFLFQKPDGSWQFSGDAKLLPRYVEKVEAFLAEQQLAEVA